MEKPTNSKATFAPIACESALIYDNEDYRPLVVGHAVSWTGANGIIRRIVLHTEAWGPGRWPRSIAGLPEADAKHLTSLGLDWTSEDPGLFAAAVEHLAARGGHGWRLAVAKGNRAWSDYAATIGADTLDAIRAWDAASGDAPLGLGLSTKGRRSTLRERIEDAVKARLAKGLPLPAGVRNAAPALLDALVSACIEEYEAEARQTKARRAAARAAALGLETKGSGSE